jgi:hypothetical protein
MVKPRNPETGTAARKANLREGYGPDNPEPAQFKAGAAKSPDNKS